MNHANGHAITRTVTPKEGGWTGSATYSPDERYRYLLTRTWGNSEEEGGRHVVWILLNPSTATEDVLDRTLRRCATFSQDLRFDGYKILNAFACRATSPRDMKGQLDPVGPDNDAWIQDTVRAAPLAIAGWGVHGKHRQRDRAVLKLLDGVALHRLGPTTKAGHPRHPLYVHGTTSPEPHSL